MKAGEDGMDGMGWVERNLDGRIQELKSNFISSIYPSQADLDGWRIE